MRQKNCKPWFRFWKPLVFGLRAPGVAKLLWNSSNVSIKVSILRFCTFSTVNFRFFKYATSSFFGIFPSRAVTSPPPPRVSFRLPCSSRSNCAGPRLETIISGCVDSSVFTPCSLCRAGKPARLAAPQPVERAVGRSCSSTSISIGLPSRTISSVTVSPGRSDPMIRPRSSDRLTVSPPAEITMSPPVE